MRKTFAARLTLNCREGNTRGLFTGQPREYSGTDRTRRSARGLQPN
jgi:hypothetical protein